MIGPAVAESGQRSKGSFEVAAASGDPFGHYRPDAIVNDVVQFALGKRDKRFAANKIAIDEAS